MHYTYHYYYYYYHYCYYYYYDIVIYDIWGPHSDWLPDGVR